MIGNLFYIFIGFFIGFANDICLKWTIDIFSKKKALWIINLSFYLRMSVICLLFCLLMKMLPTGAIFLAIGLVIDRIFVKLKNRELKNANND